VCIFWQTFAVKVRLIKVRLSNVPSDPQVFGIVTKDILLASLPKQAYLENTLSVGADHHSPVAVRV